MLSRLARAFELDGEWNQCIEMLGVCMSVVAKTDVSQSEHNDYELLMLNARHRSALDFVTLLEESLNCVNCERASPRHRVGAAVLALKLAIDFGRSDYVDAIYNQVSRFFDCPDVSELNSLEIQTIYRTSRGDGLVPINDLRRLARVARETDGELEYSHALLMAATACRLSGRYEEGLQFASQASKHAVGQRLHSRLRQTMLSETALHIAAGDFQKARKCLIQISDVTISSDSAKERNEIQLLDARIALEEGDFARAARAFGQAEAPSPQYSLARKGYYLAIAVRIRLVEGAGKDIIQPLVRELEATHIQTRATGSVDFESYSLFLGLCALDKKERALQLLSEYVRQRRVKWPLPKTIAVALNRPTENCWQEQRGRQEDYNQDTAALRTDPLSGVV